MLRQAVSELFYCWERSFSLLFSTKAVYLQFVYTVYFTVDGMCSVHGGCHANASCLYNSGSYYCQCNVGYSGNGTVCYGEILLV